MKLTDRLRFGFERQLTKEEIEIAYSNPHAISAPLFISFQEKEPHIQGLYRGGETIVKIRTIYDFTIHESNGQGYYLTRFETKTYDLSGRFLGKSVKRFKLRDIGENKLEVGETYNAL